MRDRVKETKLLFQIGDRGMIKTSFNRVMSLVEISDWFIKTHNTTLDRVWMEITYTDGSSKIFGAVRGQSSLKDRKFLLIPLYDFNLDWVYD